jgi:peptidase A4-like protein
VISGPAPFPVTADADLQSAIPAGVAQLVEHFIRNEGVSGSSPLAGFSDRRYWVIRGSRGTTDDDGLVGPYLPRIIGRVHSILICVAAIALFGMLPAAAGAHAPKHKVGRSTSTNWSGYAVDGSVGTHVIGTWTQPAVVSCSSRESSWSSPWVGIDGSNSNTVEQIGTDTDCSNGSPSYYAWYEMYPKPLNVISSVPVIPNHSYTAEVTSTSPSTYLLKLTDNSTNPVKSFSVTQTSKKAKRSSVEWVMEGPSSGLLTNFGTVNFTAASATIGGQTKSVADFGAAADPITMINSQGATRAAPFGLSGSSFGVRWQSG